MEYSIVVNKRKKQNLVYKATNVILKSIPDLPVNIETKNENTNVSYLKSSIIMTRI